MRLKIKKSVILEIFFIFLLSLTPLLWFRPGEMMAGHDNVFPLAPQAFLESRLYTWNGSQDFGGDQSLIMGTIATHFYDAWPSFLGFSLPTIQKIVYIFWFFLIGLAVYFFALLVNPRSRFFRLLAVVFYQFNFFVLQGWFIGERNKFSAYLAMPLVLSVFYLVYQGKISPFKAAVLNSLVLFFFNAGGLFGIPLYGGLMVAVGLFVFYFSLLALVEKRKAVVKRLAAVLILTVVGYFLINSYYFLPAFYQLLSQYHYRVEGVGGVSGLVSWAKMVSVGASPLNLFRLQGIAEWYDNPEHPYAQYFLNQPILIILSFLWPFLIFSSLLVIKDQKKLKFVFYFFLVYLVGLFFTAGTHPPLGFLYVFLMKVIPGFAVFRTPFYKFASSLFFSGIFLCAFTLDYGKEKLQAFVQSRPKLKALPFAFSLFWLVLIPAYHFPYFTGQFFNWRENFSTRLKVPEYVFEFGRWAEKEKNDDLRVLLVPPLNESWQYDIYDWGYLSLFPLPRLVTQQPVLLNDEKLTEADEKTALNLIYQSLLEGDEEFFQKAVWPLRIGYILIRHDFFYHLDWAKTDNPDDYQKSVEDVLGFEKVADFGRWTLYQINSQLSLPQRLDAFVNLDFLSAPPEKLEDLYSIKGVIPPKAIFSENLGEIFAISPEIIKDHYLLAPCLSCQIEGESHFVILPRVIFLPDSPFYFLVKIKEKLADEVVEPKSKVDFLIGTSLKRMAEMKFMLKDPLKDEGEKTAVIEAYQKSLEPLSSCLAKISKSDDRLAMAEKLAIYLEAEETELAEWYEQSPLTPLAREKLKGVMGTLSALREEVRKELFNRDFAADKLYSFEIVKEGIYQVMVQKETLGQPLAKNEVKIQIDDSSLFNPVGLSQDWFDFGEYQFEKGKHRLLLNLPVLPEPLSEWRLVKKKFSEGERNCYCVEIENYSPESKYRIDFSYQNRIFPDFFYFSENFVEPMATVPLLPISQRKKLRLFIHPNQKAKETQIGFCASDLTKEDFEAMIDLKARKLFTPTVLLKPVSEAKTVNQEEFIPPQFNFRRINPTKFYLQIGNSQTPFVLLFSEKFSPEWKIYFQKGTDNKFWRPFETLNKKSVLAENQFLANNYANGWVIDQKGDYDLIIEYFPQKIFYLGVMITLITFSGGVLALWKLRK